MGGAENVTRLAARAALDSDAFDEIVCFILCKARTGSLNSLASDRRVRLVYSGARSEKGGLPALAKTFLSHRYDLVFSSHTHLNAAASLFRRLKLLKTKRMVARESTMIFEREMGLRGMIARKLYAFYGAQDLIICQTARMADSLNYHTNGRLSRIVSHVPNPVDFSAISNLVTNEPDLLPSLSETTTLIAWCGRLASVKSPLRAIDTLEHLVVDERADVHLVMMGDGPMRDAVLKHARQKGLMDRLTLTGRIEKPAAIMRRCQAGLMTSDVEGFPNVILEMLAAGIRHVVTTDCAGGLNRIPGVTVTSEKTAEALAGGVMKALYQPKSDDQIATFLQERSPTAFFQKVLTV